MEGEGDEGTMPSEAEAVVRLTTLNNIAVAVGAGVGATRTDGGRDGDRDRVALEAGEQSISTLGTSQWTIGLAA